MIDRVAGCFDTDRYKATGRSKFTVGRIANPSYDDSPLGMCPSAGRLNTVVDRVAGDVPETMCRLLADGAGPGTLTAVVFAARSVKELFPEDRDRIRSFDAEPDLVAPEADDRDADVTVDDDRFIQLAAEN